MFRSLLAGTYTAVVVGIGSAIIASAIWGTAALPFVAGSSIGFAMGSLRWYLSASKGAMLDLHRYPTLMRLHLISNFPYKREFTENKIGWYTPRRFQSSWTMTSMLVAAWMSAQPALEDIQSRAEADVVASYSVDDYMMDSNKTKAL